MYVNMYICIYHVMLLLENQDYAFIWKNIIHFLYRKLNNTSVFQKPHIFKVLGTSLQTCLYGVFCSKSHQDSDARVLVH